MTGTFWLTTPLGVTRRNESAVAIKTPTRSFLIAVGILLLLMAGSVAVIPARRPWFAVLLVTAMLLAALFGYFWKAHLSTRSGLVECTAEVGAALTAAGSMSQGLEQCAQIFARYATDATVQIWSLNETTNTFELEAQAGAQALARANGESVKLAEHEIWRVAKRGTPYLFNYGQTRTDFEDAQWAAREGIEAFAGHPLIVENRVIGVLAAFGASAFSKDLLEAFASVSVALAQFVARKRAREQLAIDVADRARIEEQYRQSQKMEAVGLLAAGVAHDFNNLLTAIIGFSELSLEQLDAESPVRADVLEILKAGKSATALTRQLLAFSRRQVLEPQILDLNTVIDRADSLLRRLIGEDIEVILIKHPQLDTVNADPGQLEQVIINLVINARDAMPNGGRVTIETANVDFDESYVATHPDASVGRNVMLSVSDTGTGMDQSVLAHLFEPFFTTKEKVGATGLGLATVQGIVRQSDGSIDVSSEVGRGTTFRIYLPGVAGRD
jgi:signal transduction histidine kinase